MYIQKRYRKYNRGKVENNENEREREREKRELIPPNYVRINSITFDCRETHTKELNRDRRRDTERKRRGSI